MSRYGRIPGSTYGGTGGRPANPERQKKLGTGRSRSTAVEVARPAVPAVAGVPDPPDSVLDVELWNRIWSAMPPGVLTELDVTVVDRFISVTMEREQWAALVRQAPLLREPIVTPRGDVAGERLVINPAAKALRDVGKELDSLTLQLGLSPQSRARLGWIVTQSRLAQAETQRLLGPDFT
jgi:P27 family predicted phage terminase small subunit